MIGADNGNREERMHLRGVSLGINNIPEHDNQLTIDWCNGGAIARAQGASSENLLQPVPARHQNGNVV